MKIRFLGHACFELTDGDTSLLVDPFLTGNPMAAAEASELEPTHILLTHGHADHLGDTVDIAKRTGPQVIAIVELANEIGGEGVDNVADPNIGGTVEFPGGWVRLTPAWHTAVSPSGTPHTPAGLVTTSATRACSQTWPCPVSATRSTPRWFRSAATTRWTATTRSRR